MTMYKMTQLFDPASIKRRGQFRRKFLFIKMIIKITTVGSDRLRHTLDGNIRPFVSG